MKAAFVTFEIAYASFGGKPSVKKIENWVLKKICYGYVSLFCMKKKKKKKNSIESRNTYPTKLGCDFQAQTSPIKVLHLRKTKEIIL